MSVIGFRRWRVGRNGELRGLRESCGFVWPPSGPALASCECESGGLAALERMWTNMLQAGDAHDPDPLDLNRPHPTRKSRCGLYGYKLPVPVPACRCPEPDDARHGVVGVVRMWGRAVEHEHGWRVLYAEPVAVVDYTGRLNAAYTVRRYRDLATMYSEWAPDLLPHDHEGPVWCDWRPPMVLPDRPFSFSWIAEPPAVEHPVGAALSIDDEIHLLLEARKNRDSGPRRNPFRRRGKDQRP